MPTYNYKAIDQKGKEKNSTIEASSEEEANSKVSGLGLIPTRVELAGSPRKSAQGSRAGSGAKAGRSNIGGVKTAELTVFVRQLATLLQAGLPLLRSLEVLQRQEKNKNFKMVIANLSDNVRTGNTLSDGLAQYPKVFDELTTNMVKAGEAGGVLDVVLSRLALFMEKAEKLKKRVQAAMIYPIVVITVAVIIVAGLLVFVVPQFEQIFADLLGPDKPLPGPTEFVVNSSSFMANNILLSIGIIIALIVGFSFFKKSKPGKVFLDNLAISFPKVGGLVKMVAIARFTRTFGTLLASGVPLLQALTITRDVVGNTRIMSALDVVHDRVRDGENIATPLERTNVFPSMVTSMIDVGEETGELPNMLNRIADNYDEDVDNAVSGITSIIEPIMIVFLAVVVGFIVIALFLPMIEIIKGLSG